MGSGPGPKGMGLRRGRVGSESAAIQRRTDSTRRTASTRGVGNRAGRGGGPRGPWGFHHLPDLPERGTAATGYVGFHDAGVYGRGRGTLVHARRPTPWISGKSEP